MHVALVPDALMNAVLLMLDALMHVALEPTVHARSNQLPITLLVSQ